MPNGNTVPIPQGATIGGPSPQGGAVPIPQGASIGTSAPAQETAAQMFARKDVTQAQNEAAATQQESADFHANLNELLESAHDIRNGNIAKGAHRAMGAVGRLLSPAALAVLPASAVAAPLATGGAIAGGFAGQKIGEAGAGALGATPEQAALTGDIGAAIGGGLGAKGGSTVSRAVSGTQQQAQQLYRTALKPPPTPIAGKAAKIERGIESGLKEGIPISKGGLEKLYDLVDDLNDKVTQIIGAGQGKTVDPYKALAPIQELETQSPFARQATPAGDVADIQGAKQEFLERHGQRPAVPPQPTGLVNPQGQPIMGGGTPATPAQPIPAAEAQAEKSATYAVNKQKYGQMGAARTEAEKALARGLKDELDNLFPEAKALNQREAAMLDLEPVLNRAVQRIGNHQLLGIGTPLMAGGVKAVTGSNKAAAVAALMKAVMDSPGVKSRLAIAMYRHGVAPAVIDSRLAAFASGLTSAALTSVPSENQPANQQPSQPTPQGNQ